MANDSPRLCHHLPIRSDTMALPSFLRRNKRAASRSADDRAVLVFSTFAFVGRATYVDRSESGARLSWASPPSLPVEGVLLELKSQTALRYHRAWMHNGEAGLRFGRAQSIRGFVIPEFEHVKHHWITMRTEGQG